MDGEILPFDLIGEGEFTDLKTYRRSIDLVNRKRGKVEIIVESEGGMYDYDGHLTNKGMIYENE